MQKIEVELLTGQHNYAVIRLPERKFPGVVVPGDSLSILVSDVEELRNSLRQITDESGLNQCKKRPP